MKVLISAVYPNSPGSRFDQDYYLAKHVPFATALLAPHGLQSIRTTLGRASLDNDTPAFWVIGEMIFSSRPAFDAAIVACGTTLFADVPNYTDVEPILQVGEAHPAY